MDKKMTIPLLIVAVLMVAGLATTAEATTPACSSSIAKCSVGTASGAYTSSPYVKWKCCSGSTCVNCQASIPTKECTGLACFIKCTGTFCPKCGTTKNTCAKGWLAGYMTFHYPDGIGYWWLCMSFNPTTILPLTASCYVPSSTKCRTVTNTRSATAYTYYQTITYCYDGNKLISVSPTTKATIMSGFPGYSYEGETARTTSGGVGQPFYHLYTEGEITWALIWKGVGTLLHAYPYIDVTVYADGAYKVNGIGCSGIC